MCVGGFALPCSVFCAGEELRCLFLQCSAMTRRDLTLALLSSLQITLPCPRVSQFDACVCLKTCCISYYVIFLQGLTL